MSGYEWGKYVYLHLQHFVFTFFIKFFSFTVKQPVIWRSDLFMLTVSSYKHPQRTIGDVSQPAARCELFTATDCERRALISPCWSAPVSVCMFPPTRFSDTVHTRQPVCEVGGGRSVEKVQLVTY